MAARGRGEVDNLDNRDFPLLISSAAFRAGSGGGGCGRFSNLGARIQRRVG